MRALRPYLLRPAIGLSVLALTFALAATTVHAASEDRTKPEPEKPPKSILDIKIPIPHEPDAKDNGCHVRPSPAERETGAISEVPFWTLIDHANLKYGVKLMDGPDKLAAAVAPLDEDARTLALLYALWYNFGSDGLHTYFYSEAGSAAPLIRDTLQKAGLQREFEIFSRAMALFGKDYPLDYAKRSKFFGWSQPSTQIDAVTTMPAPLNAFDGAMFKLSDEFGQKAIFKNAIVGFVNSRPALWQSIEAQRARLNEPDRLSILTDTLWTAVGDLSGPYPEVERRLSFRSKPQRALLVMSVFNDEFRDGGVHQFFYNSSGALAPDVYDAMLELGMTQQAAIFKRGLDTFGNSYIRDTEQRRAAFFNHKGWTDWDKALSALTDDFYALNGGLSFHKIQDSMTVEGGPGIDFAMLKYAREKKLLPC